MNRIILHCDIDCFFAAVEIRDNPEYRGKPVIIGADPKEGKGRGVVATCSYEARVLGLHSGMPISQAYDRCPHGTYLRPNGEKYRKATKAVMKIIKKYSDIFQQVGGDEAYLELTNVCSSWEEVKKVAESIQEEVFKKVGITISIGCAPTKSLAKIASDFKKPNGITIFTQKNYKELLEDLDITRIPGIGKKSKIYFNNRGIYTIGDIINTPIHKMIELFGKHGKWIWNIVNGFDNREVKEFNVARKSISKERTFYEDTDNFQIILEKLEEINNNIHNILENNDIYYRTITLKIRFEGFLTYTRAKTLPIPMRDRSKALNIVLDLYKEFKDNNKKVRLIGIRFSKLEENSKIKQMCLISFAVS
ncbi:MAG: DNA polymerase IV [Candidatus Hodarchaeota archaeon]